MPLSLQTMHQRYVQQAEWTSDLRAHLLEGAEFAKAKRVLEVGSGSGALLSQLPVRDDQEIHGLDFDLASLKFAKQQTAIAEHVGGNAMALPYPDNSFDITYCHFVLLWLEDPLKALLEMRRATKRGGKVLALAEPDYGGRIDYPLNLEALGKLQRQGLRKQGAEPDIGRQLLTFFHKANFQAVESGVMGAQWRSVDATSYALETEILQSDLDQVLEPEQIESLISEEGNSQSKGNRVLYVPTFYAWGIVE